MTEKMNSDTNEKNEIINTDDDYFHYECPVLKGHTNGCEDGSKNRSNRSDGCKRTYDDSGNIILDGTRIIKIKKSCVPKTSLLYILATTNVGNNTSNISSNAIQVNSMCTRVLDVVKILLEDGRMNPLDYNNIYKDVNIIFLCRTDNNSLYYVKMRKTFFDYIGIDEYTVIIGLENFMRDNMYTKEWMSYYTKDNYYRLNMLDKNTPHENTPPSSNNNTNMLFTDTKLKRQDWAKTEENINKIKDIFGKSSLITDHVFVAGGYAYSALFGTKTGDVDLFMYGRDLTVGLSKDIVEEIITVLINTYKTKSIKAEVIRTNNAITVKFLDVDGEELVLGNSRYTHPEYQIILRIYKTPSEIIHGFDVDCCCMGFDLSDIKNNIYSRKKKFTCIYLTDRAAYSIKNGYNTVNFDRL